jgi:hypothetical protein
LVARPPSDHSRTKRNLRTIGDYGRATEPRSLYYTVVAAFPTQNTAAAPSPKTQEASAVAHSERARRFQSLGLLLVASQGRNLHEPDDDPTAFQDLLVRLLPIWDWRLPDLRTGLAYSDPRIKPSLWTGHCKQCPRVSRDDDDDLASARRVRGERQPPRLHPCPRRQYLCNRLALQVRKASHRLPILQCGPVHRPPVSAPRHW